MVELVEKIFGALPSEVKNNLCFIELKKQVLGKINEDVEVSVSEEILKKVDDYEKSPQVTLLFGQTKLIFSLELGDELCFNIVEDKGYSINLMSYRENNNLYNDVTIEIVINDGVTSLKIVESVSNIDSYYLDYNLEFYSYNKNFEELEVPNLEEVKDEDFIAFFGVEESKARECRLKFKDNREYINACKVKSVMKTIDEIYMDDGMIFSSVMEIGSMFDTIMYGSEEIVYEEDEEQENQNDEEEVEKQIDEDRIQTLEDMLFGYVGYEGEFVLSYNLVLNIRYYLNSEVPFLFTSGVIIRKLDNEYTMFNVYFAHENLMVMSKEITSLDAREMYYSSIDNQESDGLDEFFGVINKKRKDK